jgi:hypothetical protein
VLLLEAAESAAGAPAGHVPLLTQLNFEPRKEQRIGGPRSRRCFVARSVDDPRAGSGRGVRAQQRAYRGSTNCESSACRGAGRAAPARRRFFSRRCVRCVHRVRRTLEILTAATLTAAPAKEEVMAAILVRWGG